MNKISRLLLLAVAALSFASCNLDMESDGRIEMKDIFSRYERTKQYYTFCLSAMPKISLQYLNTGLPMLASFCDEAEDATGGISGMVGKWYSGATSPSYNPMTEFGTDQWTSCYNAIRYCNTFLANIANPEMATYDFKPLEKNGWIAQVRVARAFYYLQLMKTYGQVPLVDSRYDTEHDYSADKRATFEQIADFIIADCTKALATEENEQSTVGFRWTLTDSQRGELTRGMAYAIMSETALYAASPLYSDGGSKYTWAKAAEITSEALRQCLAHNYALSTTTPPAGFADNAYEVYFLVQSDPSRSVDKETIMESALQLEVWSHAGVPCHNSGIQQAGPCPSQELVDSYEMADGSQPILGYSDANHTQPIVNAESGYDPAEPYKNRDPRFYATIYYNGVQRMIGGQGVQVDTYVGGNCEFTDNPADMRHTHTGYYLRKYNNVQSVKGANADGYIPIFRLAELYLNFAEAAYQSQGPDAKIGSMSARDAVNAVRARAGMPELPAGMDKTAFEKRYRNERRVELAFENHRFFDVRRWKVLGETDKFVTGMKITKDAANGTFAYQRVKLTDRQCASDKYYFYPIKQEEVSKMIRLTGDNWQNPGW